MFTIGVLEVYLARHPLMYPNREKILQNASKMVEEDGVSLVALAAEILLEENAQRFFTELKNDPQLLQLGVWEMQGDHRTEGYKNLLLAATKR